MKPTAKKAFVSNDSSVSPDIFASKWLNKLTRTHIAVPVVGFLVYAAVLLVYTKMTTLLSNLQVVSLFFAGLLLFTFVEYVIHRWMYHPPEEASESRQKFCYTIHGIHHDYPKDKQRLAMPPLLTIAVGTILLLLFRFVLDQYSFSVLAGFMTGYALYLIVHYTIHMYKMPKNFMRALWVNHAIHHYSKDEVLFGVSTPLWDYIFRSLPKDKQEARAIEVKI